MGSGKRSVKDHRMRGPTLQTPRVPLSGSSLSQAELFTTMYLAYLRFSFNFSNSFFFFAHGPDHLFDYFAELRRHSSAIFSRPLFLKRFAVPPPSPTSLDSAKQRPVFFSKTFRQSVFSVKSRARIANPVCRECSFCLLVELRK